MSTLGYDQFIYRPTGDLIGLHHGGPITSKVGPEFIFTFTDAANSEPRHFRLNLRRGKNANIAITVDNKSSFFTRASDRTHPFSIFVPGLVGVPLREEIRALGAHCKNKRTVWKRRLMALSLFSQNIFS